MPIDKNDKTRYKIVYALEKLIEKMPFEKITVTDIMQECDMTRQTFYRYFTDKYDLVKWFSETHCLSAFKNSGYHYNWNEVFCSTLDLFLEKKSFYTNVIQSVDVNSLGNIIYDNTYQIYRQVIEENLEKPIDTDIDYLLKLFCRGGIAMLIHWIETGMERSPEDMSRLYHEGMPNKIKKLLITND